MTTPLPNKKQRHPQAILTKDKLDHVVEMVKQALSDPATRAMGQRAVQGFVWHQYPAIAALLGELRAAEEQVRQDVLAHTSRLVYQFHSRATVATLARAGVLADPRIHQGSSLEQKDSMDILCLDAKERLYMILKFYTWLQDFFRLYPMHFYENSFQFIERIPDKKLSIKVKVIGLGIGGSVCVSGLAKHGVETVVGYEKRPETGPHSVSSRYQNASWRAYDVAGSLVDQTAFEKLLENRQRINVHYDDGTDAVVTSDRVQIIIGAAIQSAVDSARRYGADLKFEQDIHDTTDTDESDMVALFCGAHTSRLWDGLADEMQIHSWPELDSHCKMWLQVQPSDKTDSYCTRGGELGAEKWHYTIESARKDVADLERIRDNQESTYKYNLGRLEKGFDIGMTKDELVTLYKHQKEQLESVLKEVKEHNTRFDYIFTNAPLNDHNLAKREAVKDSVVLDGGYTCEVKIAENSTFRSGTLLDKLKTKLVVCGGDACVPPNPLAAYGATLACEAAGSFVQLAVAHGHLNNILSDLSKAEFDDKASKTFIKEASTDVEELKSLLTDFYDAHSRSENYFQWVQTLICNLYSLPPFYPPRKV
mmetsp:Transcript_2161/g.4730  ORF Transcript_2161/g.4730 Transcript_2161/m.4730 type:complete len:593 (+) Transcript_2161:93-1871(+)